MVTSASLREIKWQPLPTLEKQTTFKPNFFSIEISDVFNSWFWLCLLYTLAMSRRMFRGTSGSCTPFVEIAPQALKLFVFCLYICWSVCQCGIVYGSNHFISAFNFFTSIFICLGWKCCLIPKCLSQNATNSINCCLNSWSFPLFKCNTK